MKSRVFIVIYIFVYIVYIWIMYCAYVNIYVFLALPPESRNKEQLRHN